MNVTIEAPWTNGEQKFEGMLGFIQQTRMQLEYFQKQNDTDHIRSDIAGYDEILKSGKEENASAFMKAKDDARRLGKPFKTNQHVIQFLKDSGSWS